MEEMWMALNVRELEDNSSPVVKEGRHTLQLTHCKYTITHRHQYTKTIICVWVWMGVVSMCMVSVGVSVCGVCM